MGVADGGAVDKVREELTTFCKLYTSDAHERKQNNCIN